MILTISILITFILDVLSLLFCIIILFTKVPYYSIAFFMAFLLFFLICSCLFFESSKRAITIKNHNFYNFSKFYSKEVDEITININKKYWIMKIGDNTIEFIFNRYYLFKKEFIRSFIIRNLQYKLISKKAQICMLMNYRFYLGQNKDITLIFLNGKKKSRTIICKNGIVRNSFISREITKAPFYKYYMSNRIYNETMKDILYIDERVYDNISRPK